jgi:hypothetical protein
VSSKQQEFISYSSGAWELGLQHTNFGEEETFHSILSLKKKDKITLDLETEGKTGFYHCFCLQLIN